jgi:hypothetical protein
VVEIPEDDERGRQISQSRGLLLETFPDKAVTPGSLNNIARLAAIARHSASRPQLFQGNKTAVPREHDTEGSRAALHGNRAAPVHLEFKHLSGVGAYYVGSSRQVLLERSQIALEVRDPRLHVDITFFRLILCRESLRVKLLDLRLQGRHLTFKRDSLLPRSQTLLFGNEAARE